MTSAETPDHQTWRQSLSIYLQPRLLVILAQGFASGMPLALTLGTLGFWLEKSGTTTTAIGLFLWVATPYSLKFLWAPIIDQMPLPILTRLLGRRRGWLLLIQLFLALAIFAMGQTDPATNLATTAIATLVMAFLAASQDIVIDAYRIEILTAEEQGAGAGATQTGSRIGSILAGAGALVLSDYVSWSVVFGILAALVLLSAVVTLLAPSPAEPERSGNSRTYADWINDAVILPLLDFSKRPGWAVILAFILFYKYGDAVGGAMAYPFYGKMGFSGTEIGAISKVFGVWMTVLGALIGGIMVARIGVFRALLIGGVLQALTNFAYCVVAWRGHDLWALTGAITIDNLAGGAAGAAFVAYLSRLTNIAFTATQYALLTSFMAFGRTVMSSPSGWLVDHLGWVNFFALTALLAVPGLLLLLWIIRLYPNEGPLREQVPA